MSVCVLLATCDRYAACGFSSRCVSLYPRVCLSGRVIAEKLIGFQLTKKFLHFVEPELPLPHVVLTHSMVQSPS